MDADDALPDEAQPLDLWTERLLAAIERRRSDPAFMARLRASIEAHQPVLDRLRDEGGDMTQGERQRMAEQARDDMHGHQTRRARSAAAEGHLLQVPAQTAEDLQRRLWSATSPGQRRRCEAIHPVTGRLCTLDRGHEVLVGFGPAHFDGMNTWEQSTTGDGEAAQRPQETTGRSAPVDLASTPPGAVEVTRLEIGRIIEASEETNWNDHTRGQVALEWATELLAQLVSAGYRIDLNDEVERWKSRYETMTTAAQDEIKRAERAEERHDQLVGQLRLVLAEYTRQPDLHGPAAEQTIAAISEVVAEHIFDPEEDMQNKASAASEAVREQAARVRDRWASMTDAERQRAVDMGLVDERWLTVEKVDGANGGKSVHVVMRRPEPIDVLIDELQAALHRAREARG